jgi:hypothetical protein
MTEANAKQGEALALLEGYWSAAMMGIKKAVAEPILEALKKHLDEIEPKLEAFSKGGVLVLQKAWELLGKAFEAVQPTLKALVKDIEDWFQSMGGIQGIMDRIGKTIKEDWPEIKEIFGEVTKFLKEMQPLFEAAVHGAEALAGAIKSIEGDPAGKPVVPEHHGWALQGSAGQSNSGDQAPRGQGIGPEHHGWALQGFSHTNQSGQAPAPTVPAMPSSPAANDLNSRLNQSAPPGSFGSGSSTPAPAGPVSNHYNVNVTIKPDPKQTADAIAKVILPAVQKAQTDHDEKTAGALAGQAAASALGGN